MFWDKKEDKHLPDLPPLKQGLEGRMPLSLQQATSASTLPAYEEKSEDLSGERHGLPSFPDSPLTKGFSQAAIKDAVVNDSVNDEEVIGLSQEPKSFKVVEVEDDAPLASSTSLSRASLSTSLAPPMALPVPVPLPQPAVAEPAPAYPGPAPARGSNVFVKIDRFNAARRALHTVQSQLESVDTLLKKVRETKMREEQEFSAWEKDMAQAKSKIDEITRAIFEKGD